MKKKLTRYDIALILFIIVVNIFLIYNNTRNLVHSTNNESLIYSNNKLVGRYIMDLNLKKEFVVETENGGSNSIKIENGSIWIDNANCSDKICLHQGKISRDGQIIVCLPHKMIIKIIGNDDEIKIDAISQ